MFQSQFWMGRLLIALALVPALALAQDARLDRIVALVEEDIILQSELDQALDSIEAQARARGDRLPPRSAMQEQMLERLILTRLEVLRAESTGIRVSDADVDQALQQVARQNNLSLDQLRQAIEADGIDFREFRADVREELLTSRLRQRVAQSMSEITETEVDILIASDRFGGAEYLLSQILIGVPETATAAQVQEGRERAEDVRRRIAEGLDFATAALSFSQAPDALEGGDVGWRPLSSLPPNFAEAIENTELGAVTEPIRTGTGFLILQVRDQRDHAEVIVQEYRARHLMVEPSELMTADAAQRRVFELADRIDAGEDFGELARRYSNDETSANIGGLLNWFRAGEYGREIQSVLDGLEPGQVSAPFRTQMGWHLLKLEETRQADRTAETMREEARDLLFRQKAQDEVERFLRQLRNESFVEIRL
ncbi:MAG: peptidylprolyl isomerase [Wenzhouxiangella sp.]